VETFVPFLHQAVHEDTSPKIWPYFTIGVVEFVNQLSYMDANAAFSLQFIVIMQTSQFAPPTRHVWWGKLLKGHTSLYQAGRQQVTNDSGQLREANFFEHIFTYMKKIKPLKLNTGLFKMIVGVLTTCHTQYT
jgi:hypothetical protein